MSELIGQHIGRYHIVEQLGRGGMATVYRALDTRLDREVAIKFIRREEVGAAYLEQLLKRFEREAKSLAQLSHPNIVKVYDYGEYEGAPYLVMEYLPGGMLKQRLGQPMPPAEAARLLAPIARALAYAHQAGIIHRDVKPANILITRSGDPMLTDFGIAKILQSDTLMGMTALTGTGVGLGTPDYMAPEQWTNEVVPQTDIYALGMVFYEMVTGRRPFSADTPAAVLIKQIQDPLPRPQVYVPDLPDEVEHVLCTALAKEPKDRYADMNAFAAALEALAQAGSLTAESLPRGQAPLLSPAKADESLHGRTAQAGLDAGPAAEAPGEALAPAKKAALPRWAVGGAILMVAAVVILAGLFAVLNLRPTASLASPTAPVAAPPTSTAPATQAMPSPTVQVAPSPTAIPPTPTVTAAPTPLGGSAEIAFMSFRDSNIEIYRMNTDGSDQVNLTRNAANDWQPAWSPDGQRLAFVSDRDGNDEIYVMQRDGSGVTRLTNNPAQDQIPVWSPDGARLAFQSMRTGALEIYVMSADGSGVRQLTSAGNDQMPAWSPDGTRLAFQSRRDGNFEIYVMNADGSNQVNVTNNATADTSPAWSPDSQRLAFSSNRKGNAYNLYLMNADGSNVARLTQDLFNDWEPAWSPDGQWLVFAAKASNYYNLYRIQLDGSLTRLTNTQANDRVPVWRPQK